VAVGVLVGVIIVGTALAGGVPAALFGRKARRARLVRLLPLAEAHGGRMREPESLTSAGYLEMIVDQVVVRLEFAGGAARLCAEFAYGEGPKFGIVPRGAIDRAGVYPRAPLGDEAFDAEFVLRCEDVEAVRYALTPRVRASLLEFGTPSLSSNSRQVTIEMEGVVESGEAMELLVEVLGEIASFGAHDVAKYASLPNVELHPPRLDPPTPTRCVLPTRAGEIELRPHIRTGPPGLALHLRHERELPAFDTKLESAHLPDELHTAEVTSLIASLTDVTLANVRDVDAEEDTLILEWPELPKVNAVLRGAELLTSIVHPVQSTGVFR